MQPSDEALDEGLLLRRTGRARCSADSTLRSCDQRSLAILVVTLSERMWPGSSRACLAFEWGLPEQALMNEASRRVVSPLRHYAEPTNYMADFSCAVRILACRSLLGASSSAFLSCSEAFAG
jgi:hypothetical protein